MCSFFSSYLSRVKRLLDKAFSDCERKVCEKCGEYACRASTTTPFHFGETITTDLANYRASQTYANEPPGEDRGETTPVGSFPPNAYGLYDMHGVGFRVVCVPARTLSP